MRRRLFSQKGFLLLEGLMTLLILAITFAAFMGAMTQALRVSVRANHATDAVSQIEALLFEIESGLRADLASDGGKGDMKNDYHYEMDAKEEGELGIRLRGSFSSKDGKEAIRLDILVLKAPVQ